MSTVLFAALFGVIGTGSLAGMVALLLVHDLHRRVRKLEERG